jgi:formylglycine-generating enzyme required for sulfatase activity
MRGNLWEWCADRYQHRHPGGAVVDPVGPAEGDTHVLRGGGWMSSRVDATSTARFHQEGGGMDVGFRVMMPFQKGDAEKSRSAASE